MGPWLIPLINLVPEIVHLFSGSASSTSAVVDQVAAIAMKATGTASPEAASDAIKDPVVAAQVRLAILAQQTAMAQLAAQKEKDEAQATADAEKALTDRIAELEGTAADLKGVPILGPLMLFARGAQRPIIGYGTLWLDYMVFSGAWRVPEGTMTNLYFLINALVLAFLFGERAVQNIAPLITDMLQARYGTGPAGGGGR